MKGTSFKGGLLPKEIPLRREEFCSSFLPSHSCALNTLGSEGDCGYSPDFRVLKAKAHLCLSFWKNKGKREWEHDNFCSLG